MSIIIYAGQDAAADWWPEDNGFPPSYDEWNAMRVHSGQPAGTFTDYMKAIDIDDTPACPFCGHTVDVIYDGVHVCVTCELTWANAAALEADRTRANDASAGVTSYYAPGA